MKKAVGLSLFMALSAQNSLAQETDVDKRNLHIFCASHLTMVSKSLAKEDNGRQALDYLSGMHRDEAMKLGANQKHFSDVSGYLKKVRNNSGKKWARLSERSKKVCLPGAER